MPTRPIQRFEQGLSLLASRLQERGHRGLRVVALADRLSSLFQLGCPALAALLGLIDQRTPLGIQADIGVELLPERTVLGPALVDLLQVQLDRVIMHSRQTAARSM